MLLLELGMPLGSRVKDLIRIVKYETYQEWLNNYIHGKPLTSSLSQY
jgi:hypothetical protein